MHETWWEIALDPNHIIAELLWTIVFDGVFVWFFYNIIFKKHILPKLRKDIHAEIDEEHGIEHNNG
ncbi:hypothetical protein UFOVP221_135 [uncultured Caudovirales phage]|uniref:Uncharacterized protein n=1 Tax=uncultured Caudovirales phage TaxID=2100421 RepID=A0A6J7WSK6_9CAUD|nr:hypothetical protein UFOVP221_135 [uncultured Caudovirales phage]